MENVIQIQAKPSQMLQSAGIMLKAAVKADEAISRMEEHTKLTQTCFCGKSGDNFRREMRKTLTEWRMEIEQLKEHIADLKVIAEEYKKAEGENKDAATRD